MAFLEVNDLTMRVDGDARTIVDGVSFDVGAGEVFALIGPSGSGKTSILRLLAGFERPAVGGIVLDGRVLEATDRHVPPERRGIGFVFQDLALFPHLTVLENVAFGLRKLPREARRRRALEILEQVEIAALATQSPQDLSGGEQQRVAIARALAPYPRLILLDEPFANLDPSLRDDVRTRVHRIIKEQAMTAIMVTHDHSEAMSVAERIGVVRAGRIEQVGVPSELYRHPRTAFVTGFLGGDSIFRARPREQGRRSRKTGTGGPAPGSEARLGPGELPGN